MSDFTQFNFRISQDTADQFRTFCKEMGMNQAQGLDHLLHVVEMDKAKSTVPERKTEIEEFEQCVKRIMSAYLTSIEINTNAEVRIREQFASDLTRKDKTIDELHKKIEQLQTEKDNAINEMKKAHEQQKSAEGREKIAIEQMESAKKNAADQDQINSMLTKQLADATSKLNGYDDLQTTCSEYKEEIAGLNRKLVDQAKAAEATLQQTLLETQLEHEKLLNEKERDLSFSQKEIETLQQKLEDHKRSAETTLEQEHLRKELAIEKAVNAKERELIANIKQVENENAKLAAQVEQLQLQINKLENRRTRKSNKRNEDAE